MPEKSIELQSPEVRESGVMYTPEEFENEHNKWSNQLLSSEEGQVALKSDEAFKAFFDREMSKRIERLVREKHKFRNIFKTSSGSVYFVLQNGESVRIKSYDGKFEEYSKHPPLKDLLFISKTEQERLLNVMKNSGRHHDGILGVPFETTPFQNDVCPIELNLYFSDRRFDTSIVEENGRVKLLAPNNKWSQEETWYEEDARGQISNGIHIGRPITQIIK